MTARPLSFRDIDVAERAVVKINQVCDRLGDPINARLAENAEIISDRSRRRPRKTFRKSSPKAKTTLKKEIARFLARRPSRKFTLKDISDHFQKSRYLCKREVDELIKARTIVRRKKPGKHPTYEINPLYKKK